MSKVILQQDDGLWAVWSTVVDDFVMKDASKGAILEYFGDFGRRKYMENAMKAMNYYEEHGKSRGVGRTYEECKEWVEEDE